MTSPRYMPLVAYADAWTPSISGVVSGRVIYVGDKSASEIQALAGQLRGAIVLTHLPQLQFVDADRPRPGLDDRPVAPGHPVPCRSSPSPASSTTYSRVSPRAGTRWT